MDQGSRGRMHATRSYVAMMLAEAEQQRAREARADRIGMAIGRWLRRAVYVVMVLVTLIVAGSVGRLIGEALGARLWPCWPSLCSDLEQPTNPREA